MKILKILMSLAVIALLSSFAVSNFGSKELASSRVKQPKAENKKPVDPLYAKFIAKFDLPNFPFSVKFEKPVIEKDYEENKREEIDNSKFLGANFGKMIPEIEDGMMSRMGPDDFVAEAIIKKSDKYDAVIYSRIPSFRSAKTYYVATFDKNGNQISKIQIAGKNYEFIRECHVSKDAKIVVKKTAVSAKYDSNVDKTRFSYQNEGSDVYTIDEDGKFVSLDQKVENDLGMR
jgi:hypothetical protein